MQRSKCCKGVLSSLWQLRCEMKIFVTEDRDMGPSNKTVSVSFLFFNPCTGRECDIPVRGSRKEKCNFFPSELWPSWVLYLDPQGPGTHMKTLWANDHWSAARAWLWETLAGRCSLSAGQGRAWPLEDRRLFWHLTVLISLPHGAGQPGLAGGGLMP